MILVLSARNPGEITKFRKCVGGDHKHYGMRRRRRVVVFLGSLPEDGLPPVGRSYNTDDSFQAVRVTFTHREIGDPMFRRSLAGLFVLSACIFPLACSEEEPDEGEMTDDGDTVSLGGSNGSGSDGEDASACGGQIEGLGACGSDAVNAKTVPANILLVLDKSGSMDNLPHEEAESTLWEATRSAIKETLEEANENVSFGLQLYPTRDGAPIPKDCYPNCCEMPEHAEMDVPIAEGAENREAIVSKLSMTAPGGGTPTAEALSRAYRYFTTGPGAELEGDKFVLLATDGGPNCNSTLTCEAAQCTYNIDGNCELAPENCCASTANREGCLDDANARSQIEDLRTLGVDTFVVGLTGSEEYSEQLDSFAEAGGRAMTNDTYKYFRVSAKGTTTGLAGVLQEITRQLVQKCDVQLDSSIPDPTRVNVAVDCSVIPRSTESPDSGEGGAGGAVAGDSNESTWVLDEEAEPTTVRLQGAICDQIESTGVERVDIVYGCPTVY